MISHVCLKDQTLAQSADTGWGERIDLTKIDGDVTLFLVNSGSSASLSVTFQIGFYQESNKPSSFSNTGEVPIGTITWVVPPSITGANTAGQVTDMTAVDCNGSTCSARVVLPRSPWVRWKITENGSNSADNVSLYMTHS